MVDFTFKTFLEDLERETAPLWGSFETKLNEAKQAIHKVDKSVVDGVLVLETDLPGVAKEDVKLLFSEVATGGTRIVIEAKRGETTMKFALNVKETVVASAAKAELVNGVLKVTVPVTEPIEEAIVEIKVS